MNHNRSDRMIKILANGATVRATAIIATDLVKNAATRHGIDTPSTVALGESMMGALLLAGRQKTAERLSLSVRGDGVLRQAVVDAMQDGTVRGFITQRAKEESVDHSAAENKGPWGEGLLSVVTLRENEKEPYVGTCELTTGHLAKDLTVYLSQSEQIHGAIGLVVNTGPKGDVSSAGGFLIEILAGASEEDIQSIENNLKAMRDFQRGFAAQLTDHPDPVHVLSQIFTDRSFSIVEERPVYFQCNCTRERVQNALRLLGAAELQDMIKTEGQAQVHCDFCSKDYDFNQHQLAELIPSHH